MTRRLWLVTLLLLLAFYVRAHNITALPPFNDESHHIRRAEVVWGFSNPDISLTVGKVLTYYWIGIFNPDRLDALWVARSVIALFALLGVAASYAIGRRLFGAWAGILGVYLLAFAPFMVFFDRMALADPFCTALGMLTVWAALQLFDHPEHTKWGWITGILAALTTLAKLIGLPFAATPALAVLLLGQGALRDRWRRYRHSLTICYGTLAGILGLFGLRVLYKELTGNRISVVDAHLINTKSPLETVRFNLEELWEANHIFNSLPLMILAVLLGLFALRYRPRPLFFVLSCLVAVWGFSIVTGGVLSTRYLQLGVPLLFIVTAVGLSLFFQQLTLIKPHYRWIGGWGVASLWILLFAQPFILNSWTDPRRNTYPDRARWEYFTNFTSGYALMDAAEVMLRLKPSTASGRIPVIGLVGSCHQIRLYLDEFGPVYLECPAFGWQGEFMDEVATYVDQRVEQESVLYMLVEPQLPYTDLSKLHVGHEVLAQFERPFYGMRVELWRVFPAEGD